jgi:hypothetical protein
MHVAPAVNPLPQHHFTGHNVRMTQLLEQAVKRIRTLPDDEQDELARVLLHLTDAEPVPLSAEQRKAIAASKAQAERGEFATDEEVRSVWASYGL